MLSDILALARRSQDTILGDLVGVAALMVMLIGALHLPLL